MANVSIYALGMVSKKLDGSMVAGAKNWLLTFEVGSSNPGCGGVDYDCPSPRSTCSTAGATTLFFHCGCSGGEYLNGSYQCN